MNAMVTGTGYLFNVNNLKSKLLRNLVVPFYCLSLKKAKKVIFQNKDNHLDFIQRGISNHNNSVIVPGSGVNLKKV